MERIQLYPEIKFSCKNTLRALKQSNYSNGIKQNETEREKIIKIYVESLFDDISAKIYIFWGIFCTICLKRRALKMFSVIFSEKINFGKLS